MAEQASRFQGLRRIASIQEGRLSPCYRVHELNFIVADFIATGVATALIESESTDLIIPYRWYEFGEELGTSFQNGVFNFYLNDNRNDRMIISRAHVPDIKNFPFYRAMFEVTLWPANFQNIDFKMCIYTFTNPRIIEDIKND